MARRLLATAAFLALTVAAHAQDRETTSPPMPAPSATPGTLPTQLPPTTAAPTAGTNMPATSSPTMPTTIVSGPCGCGVMPTYYYGSMTPTYGVVQMAGTMPMPGTVMLAGGMASMPMTMPMMTTAMTPTVVPGMPLTGTVMPAGGMTMPGTGGVMPAMMTTTEAMPVGPTVSESRSGRAGRTGLISRIRSRR